MSVITVSREFGSGGRELGRRLAEQLGFAYYDREIISALAERLSIDPNYLERKTETGVFSQLPLTSARAAARFPSNLSAGSYLLAQQHRLIKELAAKGDCVIVGRGADVVLRESRPVTMFVYAELPSRIARCRARAAEAKSDREWEREIKRVDKARAENYALISAQKWGDMHGYHLCVNTSGVEISRIVPAVAHYVKIILERNST